MKNTNIKCPKCSLVHKKNYYLWLPEEKVFEARCVKCGKFKVDLNGKPIIKKNGQQKLL
mgnify:CR=1 FL=1